MTYKTTARTTVKRNRYGGKCVRQCGGWIEPEQGLLARTATGWGAEHDGACPEQVPTVRAERVASTSPELEAGIYRKADGTIFKVQKAIHGSGMMTAKVLSIAIVKDDDGRDVPKGQFTYKGLASRFVNASEMMSREDAQDYGRIYGFCVRCGATLTDEDSIRAGLGKVCITKF
jgi:hypothetical protein